jgi:hypothetical protein
VLAHDEHCAVCAYPGGSPDYQSYAIADCGGYHALKGQGVDAGWVRFYDAGTGALVGEVSTGEACFDGNVWPAGCEAPAFATHAAWCDAYRVDGSGTRCCLGDDALERFVGGSANACSWSDNTTLACGDYDVSIGTDARPPDGYYFNAGTGKVVAAVETRSGQTACKAGPTGGFTAPTCPSPPAPAACSSGAAPK